jgi:hypothetical protein
MSLALREGELEMFVRQMGASPKKQVVLMLDRAGWHASLGSASPHIPKHVHLLLRSIREDEIKERSTHYDRSHLSPIKPAQRG